MIQKLKKKTKEAKNNNYTFSNKTNYILNNQKFKLISNLGSPKYHKNSNHKLFNKKKSEKYSKKNDFSKKKITSTYLDGDLKKQNLNLKKNKNSLIYPQSTKNVNKKTNFFKDHEQLMKKERKSNIQLGNKRENWGNTDYSKNYTTSYNFRNIQLTSESFLKKKVEKHFNIDKSNSYLFI